MRASAWYATRSELKAMPGSRLPAELWRDVPGWGAVSLPAGGSRALEWHFAGVAARWALIWALVEPGACRRQALHVESRLACLFPVYLAIRN